MRTADEILTAIRQRHERIIGMHPTVGPDVRGRLISEPLTDEEGMELVREIEVLRGIVDRVNCFCKSEGARL